MYPINSVLLVVFVNAGIFVHRSLSHEKEEPNATDDAFKNHVHLNTGCDNIWCEGCQHCLPKYDVCEKCTDNTVCSGCMTQIRRTY